MSIHSAKKSRGRPKVDSEAVNVRVDRTLLAALDASISTKDGSTPSRPEAIRRVLAEYLGDLAADDTPTSAQLAGSFYKSAQGHLLAAIEISKSLRRYDAMMFGFYNVIGFTCELYLKAYLAAKGTSYVDIKYKYGHRLDELYKAAEGLGFTTIDIPTGVAKGAVEKIIDSLADNHAGYTYRYPAASSKLNVFDDASIAHVLEIFRRLDGMIREMVL